MGNEDEAVEKKTNTRRGAVVVRYIKMTFNSGEMPLPLPVFLHHSVGIMLVS